MAGCNHPVMTSLLPPAAAEEFSIASQDDQSDDTDQTTNDLNGSRQEKIQKLVSDGAKNYPAYLKLIYTGESELSSEDETAENRPARLTMNKVTSGAGSMRHKHQTPATATGKTSISNGIRISDVASSHTCSGVLSPESNKLLDPGSEKAGFMNEIEDVNLTPRIDDARQNDARDQSELWQLELLKIQDDIANLRGMLEAKMQIANDLKRKLGITPFSELKQSVRHFKDTDTFQKTNAVFKHFGVFATKKMANFRQRTSAAFKSNEEPVLYANDSLCQDGRQLMSSKSETNVADYSKAGRKPRR